MPTWQQLRVLVLFSIGYFTSYIFLGVNGGFSPHLIHDLGLSAADLGMLTSLHFLGFAIAQIPGGVMLDHFGARRSVAGLLLITVLGAVIYSQAHTLAGLMAGRFLIGFGVAATLPGAFKALAQLFAIQRVPMVNGIVLALGGLGGVVVGWPLTWLLSMTDWRTICSGMAMFSAWAAFALWFGAPWDRELCHKATILTQFKGTWQILCNSTFWKITSLPAVVQATFLAMQSLWLGAYLRDVCLLPASQAAAMISVVSLAMISGYLFIGIAARSLERFGLNLYRVCGIGMLVFVLTQILIVLQVPLPPSLLCASYGISASSSILGYAILTESFPEQMIGRASTAFTLVMFILGFLIQIAVGAVLNHWPRINGHYPVVAHLSAWSALIALQAISAVWYFFPTRLKQAISHNAA